MMEQELYYAKQMGLICYGTGSVLCKMGGADMQCHFAPKNGNDMMCLTCEYTLSNIIMSKNIFM